MRNYRKYEHSLLSGTYDVAIIGSGLGGLTAAVLLAKAGKRVILLERHFTPGGFTHTFKRKKYEWDVGVHYVGQVNNDQSLMKWLFDIVTNKQLLWEDVGEVYDRAIINGKIFDFRKGSENFKSDLKDRFSEDHKAIDQYFDLLQNVAKVAGLFFGERTMPPLMSKTIGYFLRRRYLPYCIKTTYDALRELTDNEELIALLCAQCGNYGLPPDRSSFAMHTAIAEHYMNGAAYPKGGASEIYKTMSKIIIENGGEIYVKAEVKSIETKGKSVQGLRMNDGNLIKARNYISNAGLFNTYNHLLGDLKITAVEKKMVNKIGQSSSHLCLYAGFRASDETIGFPSYNNWIYKSIHFSKDYDAFLKDPSQEFPLVYISFPSSKDSSWKQRFPNNSTVQVVVPSNIKWFDEWQGSYWKDRPESYICFKNELKARLLVALFTHYPKAEKYLDYAEISTPLSTKHFTNYQNGEIYGLSHTPLRFKQKWIRVYSPFKNLFFTGQDILTVGVGGALFSGAFAAFGILKWRMIKVIKRSIRQLKELP